VPHQGTPARAQATRAWATGGVTTAKQGVRTEPEPARAETRLLVRRRAVSVAQAQVVRTQAQAQVERTQAQAVRMREQAARRLARAVPIAAVQAQVALAQAVLAQAVLAVGTAAQVAAPAAEGPSSTRGRP